MGYDKTQFKEFRENIVWMNMEVIGARELYLSAWARKKINQAKVKEEGYGLNDLNCPSAVVRAHCSKNAQT